MVTDWRTALRAQMNDLDTGAVARAVDSLLNYETVKYFGAEEREARRYDAAIAAYADAAVKNENSLAWLNIGQSLITNLMMAGAMGFTVWGWSQGRFTTGDVVLVNTLLAQLFRPLDLLGMVYRTIRQGLIDMEAMFALIDTPAEVVDVPGAPPLDVDRGPCPLRGCPLRLRAGPRDPEGHRPRRAGRARRWRWSARRARASRPSRACCIRFYDPTGGRITIDGQDIAEVTQASLRAAIGIVPQDTVLFNDTIGYNIGYGRDGADAGRDRGGGQGRGDRTTSSPRCPTAMTRWSASAGSSCRAARSSASPSPAPCSRTRRS